MWRPKVPTGYGILGDVVTPGTSQPTFEAMAVAVNSGLVAYPTEYQQIWSAAGGTIWRPVPPKHYVAAGDIFALDGEPPELSAMVCLHGELRLHLHALEPMMTSKCCPTLHLTI